MNIAFTISGNYTQHLAVAITSISRNNKTRIITYHVICSDLSSKNLKALTKVGTSAKSNIIFYQAPNLTKYGLKIDGHASAANYYRLFLSEILPHEIKKVLYLDADLVVLSDIQSLWNSDIENHALAAVHHRNDERANKLEIPADEYFNSGVMLINLRWWREKHVIEQFAVFIKNNSAKIKFWDQDVLNAVLVHSKLSLSQKWNQNEKTINTQIVHFMGAHKPWDYHCNHANRNLYFEYLKSTPWRNFKLPEDKIIHKSKQKIKKALNKTGLFKYKIY